MSQPIYVPMILEALAANQAFLKEQTFTGYNFTYSSLRFFSSPEHLVDPKEVTQPKPGVYLHWTLPRALRTSNSSDTGDFPLTPNRWLIVRMCNGENGQSIPAKLRAWVLESDCPHTCKALKDTGLTDDEKNSLAWNNSPYMVSKATADGLKNSPDPRRSTAYTNPLPTSDEKASTGIEIFNMGRQFDLSSWQERDAHTMFLTAVAPGNLDFSGFVNFNAGIFSFYDNLDTLPEANDPSTEYKASLSYMVCGWYSDSARDILSTTADGFTGARTLNDVLDVLQWQLAPNGTPSADSSYSLYTGMTFGLTWDSNTVTGLGTDPRETVKESENLSVAIANQGIDALSTMIGAQLEASGESEESVDTATDLLRAFQYGMLHELNGINGSAQLDTRVSKEWFESWKGGTIWQIIAADSPQGSPPLSMTNNPLTDQEKNWLSQLNNAQQQLDQAVSRLFELQWAVNAYWWLSGYVTAQINYLDLDPNNNDTGLSLDQIKALIGSPDQGPLHDLLEQLKLVNGLLAQLPQPANTAGLSKEDAYQQGIQNFASAKGILATHQLKALQKPRYWQAGNPHLVVSGMQADRLTDIDTNWEVRLQQQLITSFYVDKKQVQTGGLGSIIPDLPNLSELPAGLKNAYQEFFLLDPSNASEIARQTGLSAADVLQAMKQHTSDTYPSPQVLPAEISLDLWQQPWTPLYLEWIVGHYAIPYTGSTSNPSWFFNGTDYQLPDNWQQGQYQSEFVEYIKGRSLLGTNTQFAFQDRLRLFLAQFNKDKSQTALQQLYDQVKQKDSWLFLGQEMTNLNEFLSQRDAGCYRRPINETFAYGQQTIPYDKVIGYADDTSLPPYDTPAFLQGRVHSVPAVDIGHSTSIYPFHTIRAGQFFFQYLSFHDKFGRRLILTSQDEGGLTDYTTLQLTVDPALVVPHAHNLTAVSKPFLLPPRILQPGRLDFLLTDAGDLNSVVDGQGPTNPVGGWVIHNYLDHSLLLFLPDGSQAGYLQIFQSADHQTVQWIPSPGNKQLQTTGAVSKASSVLGNFINVLQPRSATEFNAFLQSIDAALWGLNAPQQTSDHKLSLLVGHPLALVSMKLQFELESSPLKSYDWPNLLHPDTSDPTPLPKVPFQIRLGEPTVGDDGLVGYFALTTGSNAAGLPPVFNSVHATAQQQFVRQIGPLAEQNGNYLSLFFDGTSSQNIIALTDPQASIHATTGILPKKDLVIPPLYVNDALANIQLVFRMGPILSRIHPNLDATDHPSLAGNIDRLLPAEKRGIWSWWEYSLHPAQQGDNWQQFGLQSPATGPQPGQAILHDGYLQLSIDLQADPPADS